MDTRWRVPDARYKTGYRWTPRGLRARRKWILLVVLWLLSWLLHPVLIPLVATLALGWYGVHRQTVNKRELRGPEPPAANPVYLQSPPAQGWPAQGWPSVPPQGEVRKRVPLPAAVRQAVWIRDGGRCVECGISDADCMASMGEHLHYDHVVPFSQNGADTVNNICLRCPDCNRRKSNRFVG
jgi:HNH endonuclease